LNIVPSAGVFVVVEVSKTVEETDDSKAVAVKMVELVPNLG